MKIKYVPHIPSAGIPVADSRGNQIVTGILQDGYDIVVIFVDTVQDSLHIEMVKNPRLGEMLQSSNFRTIDDEQQWKAYAEFFKENGCAPKGSFL